MRSFAIAALLGSAVCAGLAGQSLTEHAAAAAGGTIGTAAGKPLGTALGRIFGNVDNTSTKAAGTKSTPLKPATKSAAEKSAPVEISAKPGHTASAGGASSGGDAGGAESSGGSSRHSARQREEFAREETAVPLTAPVTPVVAEPKAPTMQDLDGIKVGTPGSDLRTVLGAPESRVSIPDDDGHLRETLQYWANGEPIGTVRLDNGRVVSVQTNR